MSKIFWKSLVISPALLGAALLAASGAIAAEKQVNPAEMQFSLSTAKEQPKTQAAADLKIPAQVAQTAPAENSNSGVLEQLNRYSNENNGGNSFNQVTNVSQFSDVKPTDWAYGALRDLVERYGCIAGYPDGFFRGNRAMTRYEFAAGLNACLKQVERLIASVGGDFATKEDLEKLRRLVQEFQAELATLGTRVDKLESRVQFLEDHQFSTTTKLVGEAIFALTSPFDTISGSSTVFADRVRLDLQTSFTGKDILHTRLAAGSTSALVSGVSNTWSGTTSSFTTYEGNQTFNSPNNGNSVILDWLAYEFPFQNSKVYIAATGGLHSDYVPTLNPYFDDGDGGKGALSTFAQYSPIYRIGGGAGAGIRFSTGGSGKSVLLPTSLTFGYLAENGNTPGLSSGLFNGGYSAIAQANFTIGDAFSIAATYVNGYHVNTANGIYNSGGTGAQVGSAMANTLNDPRLGSAAPARLATNSYGVEAAFRFGNGLSLSGFAMQSNVRFIGLGDGEVWSFGGGLALPDLGKKGNVLGLFVGAEPTLRGISAPTVASFERDYSWHYEAFYKYQVSDNVSITPGVIWLTAPGQRDVNRDVFIGTLRTTFSF